MDNEPLDDKYRSGVYYDMEAQRFCNIDVENGDIVLSPLDGEDPFYHYEDTEDFDGTEFVQIEKEAIEHPEEYIRRFAHRIASGRLSNNVLKSEQVSLRYALQVTED